MAWELGLHLLYSTDEVATAILAQSRSRGRIRSLPDWKVRPTFRQCKVDLLLCSPGVVLEMFLDLRFAFGFRGLMYAVIAILEGAGPKVARALRLVGGDIVCDYFHLARLTR